MTTQAPVLSDFFGAGVRSDRDLDTALRSKVKHVARELRRPRRAVGKLMRKTSLQACRAALDIDCAAVLANGWADLDEVVYAAREGVKGQVYALPIRPHQLESNHRPPVRVFYASRPSSDLEVEAHVNFDVEAHLTFKIEPMHMLVCDGAIIALCDGAYAATGELKIEGVRVLSVDWRRFEIRGDAPLARPVAIRR